MIPTMCRLCRLPKYGHGHPADGHTFTPPVGKCGRTDSHGGHVIPNGPKLAFCAGTRNIVRAY